MSKILPDDVSTITVVVDAHPSTTMVGTLYVHLDDTVDEVDEVAQHLHTLEELPLWLQERVALLCMAVPSAAEYVSKIDGVGSVWDYATFREFGFRPAEHNVPPEVVAQCLALCGWEV